MTENQVRQLDLAAEITCAIENSELDWPDVGYTLAGALTEWLGNPVALRVRGDGVVRLVDRDGTTERTDTPESMAKEFLQAMPGETNDERMERAAAMLSKVRATLP